MSEKTQDLVALAEKCGAEVGRLDGQMVWAKFHKQSSLEAFATGVVMRAAMKPHSELVSRLLAASNYIDTLGGNSQSYRIAISHLSDAQKKEGEADMGNPITPPAAAEAPADQWISVGDERKPELGQVILMWVHAENEGEDDDGRPFSKDCSQVQMGEYRDMGHGPFFDCFATPFADHEGVTHWMPLPEEPGTVATPTDSAANAGAVPSDDWQAGWDAASYSIAHDPEALIGVALQVAQELDDDLRPSGAVIRTTLIPRMRALLAPKADSSEPRAEQTGAGLRAVAEHMPWFPSPASAQVGEVDEVAAWQAAMDAWNAGTQMRGFEEWCSRFDAARAAFLAAQPQADAGVSQIKWPKGRDVARNGDMAPVGQDVLRLVLDSDNDVCMEMWHSGESAAEFQRVTIEFCNGGGGGGQSPKTRAALINLMTAMEEDNADAPHKAHGISPAPKEGEV